MPTKTRRHDLFTLFTLNFPQRGQTGAEEEELEVEVEVREEGKGVEEEVEEEELAE